MPRSDVRVHDTWRSVGLRATGSHNVSVDGVFVPAHRSFLRESLAYGSAWTEPARCHRVPYDLVASLFFCAPALGAARGALRSWQSVTAGRRLRDGRFAREDVDVQRVLARSSAEIDLARLALERVANEADEVDEAEIDPALIARNVRDCAVSVELLLGAVERIVRQSGTSAHDESSDVQRFWRDIQVVASHATLGLPAASAAYARVALG
ncbi:acyl-CoA dehydrogenase family protein [Streptomyces sp. AM 4-1-1]|uniref:acyl-CoA dehydrogenase family protein n=1 Tax=unclassified Streptomyces TaxID=2593676 RepID=UPI0023BA25BC|nr:acyl-CoA dehydrogenase family protein [Streptomyces sp. AM 4-1-1]WEH34581.1 acyl-CoA dehydrogenase family protein [Streptomyces sp. AM 4-1-1]